MTLVFTRILMLNGSHPGNICLRSGTKVMSSGSVLI